MGEHHIVTVYNLINSPRDNQIIIHQMKKVIKNLKAGISLPGKGFLILDAKLFILPLLTTFGDYNRTSKYYKESEDIKYPGAKKISRSNYRKGQYYGCIYSGGKTRPFIKQIIQGLIETIKLIFK